MWRKCCFLLPFHTSKKSGMQLFRGRKKKPVIRKYKLYFPNSSLLCVTPELLLCLLERGLISELQTQSSSPVFKALRLIVFLFNCFCFAQKFASQQFTATVREKIQWCTGHLRASKPDPTTRLGNPRVSSLLLPLPSFYYSSSNFDGETRYSIRADHENNLSISAKWRAAPRRQERLQAAGWCRTGEHREPPRAQRGEK